MRLTQRFDGPRPTMILILGATAVAAALLINAMLAHAWSIQSTTRQARGEAVATQIANALASHVRLMQQAAVRLASGEVVHAALEEGTEHALAVAQRSLSGEFPGLDSAQLVVLGRLGTAASGFSPSSLHNNIEVSLVADSFNNRHPAVEAFADGTDWLLAVAAPVSMGTGEGGVVILRTRLKHLLRDYLSPGNKAGSYLLAVAGRGVVASVGDAARDAPPYLVSTVVRDLQAGFRPGNDFLETSSVSALGLIAATIGGELLLIAVVLFGFRQMHIQLIEDAGRLGDLALHQRASTATVPPLHYPELVETGEALVELRQRTQAELRRVREEQRSTLSRPPPEADPLEILVSEDGGEDLEFEGEPELLVPVEIFRDYDIRGQSALISPLLAYAIGQAVGSEALERDCATIVVGADGRSSSPALREQLVAGLLTTGVDVIDVGTVATPMLYFACQHLETGSGVMITGSHNPADHNGFKIMLGGETLCGEHIVKLRERILEEGFTEGQGSYRVAEINADYLRAICDDVLVDRPFRIVVDCGNGAASVVAVELFEELGCEVTPLFCELDGRFPNHAPDPSDPTNLRHLLSEVLARHADLGIAFDGDGDRIGVVTAKGRILAADYLLMLFARELLSRHPGADVVFDVKCSQHLSRLVANDGGRPIMWRSGHSWIKEKMKEAGAMLGGEFTGHICFRDRWFGFDDALYAAARLLEILSSEERSLDELLSGLPQAVATPELRIEVPETRKFGYMETISAKFAPEGARLVRIDGIRAEFRAGWGLLRASNTSAALILRFEASDEAELRRIQELFRNELKRLLPELEPGF